MVLHKSAIEHRFIAVAMTLIIAIGGLTSAMAQLGSDQGLVTFHRADVFKGKGIRFKTEQDG